MKGADPKPRTVFNLGLAGIGALVATWAHSKWPATVPGWTALTWGMAGFLVLYLKPTKVEWQTRNLVLLLIAACFASPFLGEWLTGVVASLAIVAWWVADLYSSARARKAAKRRSEESEE